MQPSALTYTNHRNIDSEFSSQHARSKLSHCRRDSEESMTCCVSWKEVQWFSMEERLTPGVLWAATCACFRGLQGWKTRVGWETWLCFTLVLQELPAVKVYVSVAEGLRHYADVYMDVLLSYPLQLLTEFLPLYILFYIFAHCCLQFVLFWKHLTFSFCLRRYAMKHYFWRKALTCLVNSNLVYPPNDLIVVTWSTFRFFRTRDEAMQILLADMFKVAF